MLRYLPNLLTTFRIVAIPYLIYFILIQNMPLVGFIIFVVASLTDYFDGYLARKLNIVSNFGKFMDPLADKCLVLTALGLLWYPIGYLHYFVLIIIALRELIVSIIRLIYRKKEVIIPANLFGKIKTGLQLGGIMGALLFYTLTDHDLLLNINDFMICFFKIYFYGVVIVTVWSGIDLFVAYRK